MKYMGSKNRIAKHILPTMLAEADKHGITTWVEPFVGGGNIIDKVPSRFERVGYDLNPHTIAALIAIRDHVDELPDEVSEAWYKSLKGKPANPVESWIRFACSFGGKLDNGYARESGSDESTFCGYGKRNAQKQSPNLQGVHFEVAGYDQIDFSGVIYYCDPPYQGTTGYKTGAFDHEHFFNWCRRMKAQGNVVFVSEYNAPDDFELVWEGEIKTNFASNRKEATHKAVERLYKV